MALARLAKYGLKLGGGGRGASIRIYRFSPCIITPLEHLNVKMNLLSISWVRGIRMTPNYEVAHAAERIAEDSDLESESPKYPSLEATKEGEKPRVVVLGSGWAACRFLKSLNTKLYDVVCISPRNHMVFTPLLASTCVGTLEFRSVVEPVVRIQTALANDPNSYFYLATCSGIDISYLFMQDEKGLSLAGFLSWFIWRSAYLTRVVSWRNRFYVAVNWATTLVFGRDNSRIG